jgi:hypothetical protein
MQNYETVAKGNKRDVKKVGMYYGWNHTQSTQLLSQRIVWFLSGLDRMIYTPTTESGQEFTEMMVGGHHHHLSFSRTFNV